MAPSKSNGKVPVSYRPIKARTENWTTAEKLYLIDLCGERLDVIEDRRIDAMSVLLKARTWDEIHELFSRRFADSQREMRRIREQWKRLKVYVRVEVQKRLRQKEQEEEERFQATKVEMQTEPDLTATANLLGNGNGYSYEGGGNGSTDELNPVIERMLNIVPHMATGLTSANDKEFYDGEEADDDSLQLGMSMHHPSQQPAVICDINLADSDGGGGGGGIGHADIPKEETSPHLNLKVTSTYSLKSKNETLVRPRVQYKLKRNQRKKTSKAKVAVRPTRTVTARTASAAAAAATISPSAKSASDYERLRHERQLAMLEEEHCATMEIIAIKKQVALLEKRIALKRLSLADT